MYLEQLHTKRRSINLFKKMSSHTVLTQHQSHRSYGGYQKVFSHQSKILECTMKFGIYLPPQAEQENLPIIFFLSGLSATEQNFIIKSGAQKYAAEYGVILVNPDTSPRGDHIPDDPESWDFGVGAGYFINATQDPWKKNFRMYDYFMQEFQEVLKSNFPLNGEKAVMGHSMGGHGALITALKNPGFYRSVSVFSPISNPSMCHWGIKAFSGYFGPKSKEWSNWDATELVKKYDGPSFEVLIVQGTGDHYNDEGEILIENFVEAAKNTNRVKTIVNYVEGYDHGFYFVSTFIGEHIKYHMNHFSKHNQ